MTSWMVSDDWNIKGRETNQRVVESVAGGSLLCPRAHPRRKMQVVPRGPDLTRTVYMSTRKPLVYSLTTLKDRPGCKVTSVHLSHGLGTLGTEEGLGGDPHRCDHTSVFPYLTREKVSRGCPPTLPHPSPHRK